jgi:hypothetical protein
MKTIKEQYKEIVSGFNDERTENVANRCAEIAEETAIKFALFLSDNLYEYMYQDIDNDGKTWVTYRQEGYEHFDTAERFTIQELFKKSQKL